MGIYAYVCVWYENQFNYFIIKMATKAIMLILSKYLPLNLANAAT